MTRNYNFRKLVRNMRIMEKRGILVKCLECGEKRFNWETCCDPKGWSYEDELPEDMPQVEYDAWFEQSRIVEGVRVGPKWPTIGSAEESSREVATAMYETYRYQIAEVVPECYQRLKFDELKPAMQRGWLAVAHEVEQRNYQLLNATQMAYRKHHMGDESIGWDESAPGRVIGALSRREDENGRDGQRKTRTMHTTALV